MMKRDDPNSRGVNITKVEDSAIVIKDMVSNLFGYF